MDQVPLKQTIGQAQSEPIYPQTHFWATLHIQGLLDLNSLEELPAASTVAGSKSQP